MQEGIGDQRSIILTICPFIDLNFNQSFSSASVFAFRQPFAELGESNPVTVLWRVAESGLRPPRIQDLPEPLMELIERRVIEKINNSDRLNSFVFWAVYRCWANNPDDRPCLEEVRQVIEAFLEVLIFKK